MERDERFLGRVTRTLPYQTRAELAGEEKVVFYYRWCKSCEVCVAICPRDALTMADDYPKLTYPERCTECGLCEVLCPDFAITVPNRHEKKKAARH